MPNLRLLVFALLIASTSIASAQDNEVLKRDAEIAARFSPVFYQALGDKPRSDYITNFDFDGDWRGDNNWANAGKTDVALKAFIYYSVAETSTHVFIHYAVFHPRDYKGGEGRGTLLSELIRQGIELGGKYDPTGLADEATLAHENDMEGALVVVKKKEDDLAEWSVEFVETLQHNMFARYRTGDVPDAVRLEDARPVLYIEPKGHGIEAFVGDRKQTSRKDFLRYKYGGQADDADKTDAVCRDLETTACEKSISYDLVPLLMLWTKSKSQTNETYGVVFDYGQISISTKLTKEAEIEKKFKIGKRGCAFLGKVGGVNMARPPWGWFDSRRREDPLGQWFFDPAKVVKRDYGLDSEFSTAYTRLPFWVSKLTAN